MIRATCLKNAFAVGLSEIRRLEASGLADIQEQQIAVA
jgi:hypothetical protein